MNKTVLCILGQKQNSYKDPFLVYSDLFEIKYINNLPTLVELLKGKSLYYYNEELKSKNRFKCKLIKLLHKRFDNEAIFKTFFKYNKSDFETLILVHSPYIKPWIETHYPKNISNKVCWYYLPIGKSRISKKIIKETLNHLSSMVSVDKSYAGKIIILNEDNIDLIKCIKYKYPNAKIYVRYVDTFIQNDPGNSLRNLLKGETYEQIQSKLSLLKDLKVNVITYNKTESDIFNIDYIPNRVDFNKLRALYQKSSGLKKQWFFAGSGSGNRFQNILNLAVSLVKAKINSYFIIIDLDSSQKQQLVNLTQNNCFTVSFEPICYDDYLVYQISSPVFIDIFRLYPDEGYSYRIAEALALSKNIITNRECIKNEKFYNSSKIYLTDDFKIPVEDLVALSDISQQYNDSINEFDINISHSIVESNFTKRE